MTKRHLLPALAAAAMTLLACSCTSSSSAPEAGAEATGSTAAISAIMTRTSVRSYTADSVSQADVQTLLRAAMAAPTAVNKQPWRFVVITDSTLRRQLADSIESMAMIAKAPVAIAVCGDLGAAMEGYGRDFWIQDCSAATENLLVAANALGLGAVWCGVYPIPNKVAVVKSLLKLPEQVVPLCVVPVGHPAGQNQPKDKWRADNVHYNTWD